MLMAKKASGAKWTSMAVKAIARRPRMTAIFTLPVDQAARPGGDPGQDREERGLASVSLDVEAGPREDGQAGPREEGKLKAEPAAPHGGAHSTYGS